MIRIISRQHLSRSPHFHGIYLKGYSMLLDNPNIVKSYALGGIFIDKGTDSTFCKSYKRKLVRLGNVENIAKCWTESRRQTDINLYVKCT